MAFGKKSRIEFDATRGPTERTADLYENPQSYSFIHNYKVHFKRSALQMVANKIDISVGSRSSQLPGHEEVVNQFNDRALVAMANPRTRISSYHITNVEYKESIAMPLPENQRSRAPPLTQPAPVSEVGEMEFVYCLGCGSRLPFDSRFCNKCGLTVP